MNGRKALANIGNLFREVGAHTLWRKRMNAALTWVDERNPDLETNACRLMLACWLGKVYCNVEQPYRLWRLSPALADVAALLPLLRVESEQPAALIAAANDPECERLLQHDKELMWQREVINGRA